MILRVLIVGPLQENTYVVGSEDTRGCVVIDPGAEADLIIKDLASQGLAARYIVNTHGHFDHIGAVAAVREATGASYGIHANDEYLLEESEATGKAMVPGFRQPPRPDFYLRHDDVLEVGSLKLKVIDTAGHTPGSVCFYTPGVLFTGDTLFQGSIGRHDFPKSDGRLLVENVKTRLLVLPDETYVLPGHGPQSTIGDEKRWNPFLA